MSGTLLLLGLAISAFTLGGIFDSGSSSDDADEPTDEEMPVDTSMDILVDAEFQTALTDTLDADILETIDFVDGPLDVDTGDGDDIVSGGSGSDQIMLGAGDDAASGGAGDDLVDLGDGDDFYSAETAATALAPVFGDADLGDDIVLGGAGDDLIVDTLGSNTLDGGDGDDLLQSLDAATEETVTPDRVLGGDGDDTFVVDQGDVVITGSGNDDVQINIGDDAAAIAGMEVVTIEDFDPETDALQLNGTFDVDDLRIEISEAGGGSTVFWNDTAIVNVVGGQELTLADIFIAA